MIDIVQQKLDEIMNYSKANEKEAIIIISDSSLTRFANNVIHQNVSRKDINVLIRVIIGKRIGIVNVNSFESEDIKKSVDKAIKIAESVLPKEDFVGLAKDTASQYVINRFDGDTQDFSPIQRAEKVKNITGIADKLNASGSIENGVGVLGIANSSGIDKVQEITQASLNLVVSSETSSGYAAAIDSNINHIDFEEKTEKAVENVKKSVNPHKITSGKYMVYLEPYAVAELLGHLSYSGMGALSVQENRSFMSNNIGKKIMSDKVSIYDDAKDKRTLGFGFDYEGVTRQKVTLIEKGKANSPVYDTQTAAKEKKESTGHALPASAKIGPLPLNLIMGSGSNYDEEMISGIKKGIYITRFHYTNLENPIKTILTGMTRDGTYLIEKGKITKPLNNLRFTQSIVDALNNVVCISKEQKLVEGIGGVYIVPSLAIDNFNFTSTTEF